MKSKTMKNFCGLFYEQFGFEVAMEFFWLLMSGLNAAIVPGAIVGSAVGDASQFFLDRGWSIGCLIY